MPDITVLAQGVLQIFCSQCPLWVNCPRGGGKGLGWGGGDTMGIRPLKMLYIS